MSDLATLPFLIVPTEQILYKFRVACAVLTNADYDITELVSEACAILESGSESDIAYRTEVIFNRFTHTIGKRDAEVISKAWFNLAMETSHVYARLRKQLGILPHTRLPYYLAAILPTDDLKLGRYDNT